MKKLSPGRKAIPQGLSSVAEVCGVPGWSDASPLVRYPIVCADKGSAVTSSRARQVTRIGLGGLAVLRMRSDCESCWYMPEHLVVIVEIPFKNCFRDSNPDICLVCGYEVRRSAHLVSDVSVLFL